MEIFCEAIVLMSPAVLYLKKITYSFRLFCKIKREKIVKILKKTAQKQNLWVANYLTGKGEE